MPERPHLSPADSTTPSAGPSNLSPGPLSPTSELRHFNKFGPDSHIAYHDAPAEEEKVGRLRDLIKAPTIRQWVEDGKIHREPCPREVPRVELFFDLLFVGIIHQLAEAAVEDPGGPAVLRFILTFWPSWSIWEEARKYSNVSGQDDLLHRCWVLLGMICILGYTVNASAIELHEEEAEVGFQHNAVQAAVTFCLAIKLTRVIVLFYYAYSLPLFRKSQMLTGISVLIPMFFYLPLIWVENVRDQIILAAFAIFVDIIRIDLIVYNIYGRIHIRRMKRQWTQTDEGERGDRPAEAVWHRMPALPSNIRIPAMNIEHAIERSSAFVVIVLGELVANLLYIATSSDVGASLTFGKAALGLMVAWALNYIYMIPSEPNCEYEHGLRRNWISGILFTFFHWPLCASLVLASAASGKMVTNEEVDAGVYWYWGCGLGFAVIFMTGIDLCHRNLAPPNAHRIPRSIRATLGIACGLALILYPIGAEHMTPIANMGLAVAMTWALLAVHIVGILPRADMHIGAIRHKHDPVSGNGDDRDVGM